MTTSYCGLPATAPTPNLLLQQARGATGDATGYLRALSQTLTELGVASDEVDGLAITLAYVAERLAALAPQMEEPTRLYAERVHAAREARLKEQRERERRADLAMFARMRWEK